MIASNFTRSFVYIAALFLLLGCAAPYNTNFPLVEKRMTQAKVVDLLGKPVSGQSGPGDSKILFWRLASSPLDTDGSDTREYWVQLQDDQVIGYGERVDQVTMTRQAAQYQAAWNAAATTTGISQSFIEASKPSVVIQAPSTAPATTNCTKLGNTVNCRSY